MVTMTDSTGDRIVAAATTEFSQHGIAGARIERIARAARTSKERVYAYYRSKDALYRFVAARELAAIAEATRLDPTDLPGYAGRIHDYFVAHPERLRLMNWGQLEVTSDAPQPDDPFQLSIRRKIDQLRAAQQAGDLDPAWDPIDILVFVNQIAMSWAAQPHVGLDSTEDRASFLAARRAAIVAAVQRLFPAVNSVPTPEEH
ncbi:TetR family transcriptional regulator [Paractinoplanes tereljensis]|uniref:TetR family transcriptional regulator n=2 Tax=Paractinoplanes tereljensis TaxID=571912 RepID=A0A919NKJ1_9ACTN|nr:TetR family transcriptional regulator [Actinoplanes tereljensis]